VASSRTLHVTEWNGHTAVLQLRCWTPNGDCYRTRSDTGELIDIDYCNAVEPLEGEPPWTVAIEWFDDGLTIVPAEDPEPHGLPRVFVDYNNAWKDSKGELCHVATPDGDQRRDLRAGDWFIADNCGDGVPDVLQEVHEVFRRDPDGRPDSVMYLFKMRR